MKSIPRARGACLMIAALVCVSAPGTGAAQDADDCSRKHVLCVADSATPGREFSSIQDAVDAARRGDTVLVFRGRYDGFTVTRSGTRKRPIVIEAMPGARIVNPAPNSDRGIELRRVSYVHVRGFRVLANGMRNGIAASDATAARPMRGLVIADNHVSGARSTNIYLSQVSKSVVASNIAANSKESHGIYLANAGSDNTELRGNHSYGNAKNGIHLNGDARYGGDGLHTGVVADGNVVYDNVANGFDLDGVQKSTFVNNVAYGNGRHGLRAFAIDAAAGPAKLVIANNTLVDNGAWAIKLTQDRGGHRVFNNILLSGIGGLAVDARLRADYNVATWFSLDGDETRIGINAWRAAGYGASTFSASENVLFENARSRDYALRHDSPAVDAGRERFRGASAPAIDAEGRARPVGSGPDIGALERASGGAS